MFRALIICLFLSVPLGAAADAGPSFDASGRLQPPEDYRTWVFLTSGFGMAYGPSAAELAQSGVPAMDNVYVNRAGYDGFQRTGVWPEGTMFVLEIRAGEGTGSIVTTGHYQTYLIGLEAAVKDSKRFPGRWGYFAFEHDGNRAKPATLLPRTASCYSCHQEHGAVESTFTQFYPTMFPIARAKGKVRVDFVGIPPDLGDLVAAVHAGGWPAAEKLPATTQAEWPKANLLREGASNAAGYRLLGEGKQAEAIAAFESATRRFPGSTNAWDSLSEAYEAAGRKTDALAAVEKGLAAAPADKIGETQRGRLLDALKARGERLRKSRR